MTEEKLENKYNKFVDNTKNMNPGVIVQNNPYPPLNCKEWVDLAGQ